MMTSRWFSWNKGERERENDRIVRDIKGERIVQSHFLL